MEKEKKIFLFEELHHSVSNHGTDTRSEYTSLIPMGYFEGTLEDAEKLKNQIEQLIRLQGKTYTVHGDDIENNEYPKIQYYEPLRLTLR